MAIDQGTMDKAAAEADAAAPPPTVTDLMPKGAGQVGGRPATPLNAASLRFLQAVSRALGEDIADEDCMMFALYCRVKGATKAGRAELWRRSRDPLAMWDDYHEWAFATGPDEFNAMMAEHLPEWVEVAEAQQIVNPGGELDGGPEGNATGSQSS